MHSSLRCFRADLATKSCSREKISPIAKVVPQTEHESDLLALLLSMRERERTMQPWLPFVWTIVMTGIWAVLPLALYSDALSAVSTFVATRSTSIRYSTEILAYLEHEARPRKMSKGLNGLRVYFQRMFDLLSCVGCQNVPFEPE